MPNINLDIKGPHEHAQVLAWGNQKDPKRALLLFHGRGASADDIIRLAHKFPMPEDVLVLAPDAIGHTWYPNRFIEPRVKNEPHLSSALSVVDALINYCEEEFSITPKNIVLAGFSQGACLTSEYIARNPKEYAGACVFSGGLIGSDEEIQDHKWKGDLEQTPLYLGCDAADFHIPKERVDMTATILQRLNAHVTEKIYTGLGHTIHPEGIEFLQKLF